MRSSVVRKSPGRMHARTHPDDYRKARQECLRLIRAKGKGPWQSDEAHDKYREARRKAVKLLKKSNMENWKQFTTETADTDGAARLMKIFKKGEYVPPTLLKSDNTFTNSQESTLKLLMDTHFPQSLELVNDDVVEDNFEDIIDSHMTPSAVGHVPWIDAQRIRRAIKSFSGHGTEIICRCPLWHVGQIYRC